MSQDRAAEQAWSLTRAITPRPRVRVAAIDASGQTLNQFSGTCPVDQARPPSAPWAVHLATPDGFRLIAFDLDAKHGVQQVHADTATLLQLLHDAGIPAAVCQSGPSGGRHIWTATTEPVAAELVASLARLAAAILPSLDIAPLRNAATGCVRPPGSPHRDGGHSTLIGGDLAALTRPTIGRAEVEQLTRTIAAHLTGPAAEGGEPASATVRIDPAGHPYLPGARRPLPAASRAALETTDTDAAADASSVLNTVLLGAAASHWHLADIAELVPTAPGLEHVRTRRGSRQRHARHPRDQRQTLARHWRYAVRYVREHPRKIGLDSSFDLRAGRLADTVRTAQEHADAAAGRWTQGGGASDRRVLDCLHLWALAAVTTTLEADIRRLALACGIGRETARVALQRLTADGWIDQVKEAAGVHGATWTISPERLLHRVPDTARSQAATRPEGAGAAERTALTQQLQRRIELRTHAVFSGNHALPLAAGNLYAQLAQQRSSPAPPDPLLTQLVQHGLLVRTQLDAWVATDPGRRDAIARALNVHGRLNTRRLRYQAERAAWSWWQAEHDWMRSPRSRRDTRSRPDQTPLWQTAGTSSYPRHPRGPDGRASFAAARAAIQDGALSAPLLSSAA